MNCELFFERLDAFVEGRLSEHDAEKVREHLETCLDCEALAATFAEGHAHDIHRAHGAHRANEDIADAVLQHTSGSPCSSAHDRLGDHADGSLASFDRQLVDDHLSNCRDCTALAQVIARMQETLPLLAEMEPTAGFVADVLNATSRRPALVDRWVARIAETGQALLRRPRIAWEGAYIGTFVLVLLFGTPTSPFARVPQQALDVVGVNPVAELKPPAEEAWRWIDGTVETASREVRSEVTTRSSKALERIKRDLGTFWQRVTSEQETDDTPQGENK